MPPPIRLPPPPFWRTLHFEHVRVKPDRERISEDDISSVLQAPTRRLLQPDERHRCWGWLPATSKWPRAITLADGKTVHNVFFDRSCSP